MNSSSRELAITSFRNILLDRLLKLDLMSKDKDSGLDWSLGKDKVHKYTHVDFGCQLLGSILKARVLNIALRRFQFWVPRS